MNKINIIGALLGLATLALAAYWFDWKLSLIIFLALLANNLERKGRVQKLEITKEDDDYLNERLPLKKRCDCYLMFSKNEYKISCSNCSKQ